MLQFCNKKQKEIDVIRLNSDLGEGFGAYKMGDEELIMPHIDMANIACGFHAGDPITVQKTINLALKHNVSIGAHPSYPDLVGFGRRSMKCSFEEIEAFVIYQIGALSSLTRANGGKIEYVKPHGALYNDMMRDDGIIEAIMRGVSRFDNSLKLMILSTLKNSHYESLAKKYGINLYYEVFADRAYKDDGFLVPRSQENSVLHVEDDILKRLDMLQKNGVLMSINSVELPLKADSLCVHGDNPEAIRLVKSIRENLV